MPIVSLYLSPDTPLDVTVDALKAGARHAKDALARESDELTARIPTLTESVAQYERMVERSARKKAFELGAYNLLRDRLDRQVNVMNDASARWRATATELGNQTQELRNLQFRLEQIRSSETDLARQIEDDALFTAKAELLRRISGYVDPSQAVDIDPSIPAISWTTTDIYIKDGFGGFLPRNFGRFLVRAELRKTSSSTMAHSQITSIDHGGDRFPHPHIRETTPCLGATTEQNLVRFLRAQDFAMVVTLLTEYLQSYNYESPYARLYDHFRVPNRWENEVCSSGEHLTLHCTCDRCLSCGERMVVRKIKYDCGSCATCCIRHHQYDPDAAAEREGINGTGCMPRALRGWFPAPATQQRQEAA